MPPIYLDYQASTPLLPEVREKMTTTLGSLSANPHSTTHLHGREASSIVELARENLSKLICCEPENIIFTSGASESNNFLIKQGAALKPNRKTILVSKIEHKCVLETAHSMSQQGYKIVEIKTDKFGFVDTDHFASELNEEVALVSIMAANNEIGTILGLPDLIKATHNVGALFHSDAAQYISHADFDASELDADFVSLSAHKMYGPKGIGAAYISPHAFESIEPFITGGGQQDGKRGGTLSPLLCSGFGEAANQYLRKGHLIRAETIALRDRFFHQMTEIFDEDIRLLGPNLNTRHAGNLNLQFKQDASTLLGRIAPYLSASNGSACSSGQITASHVLRAIGLKSEEAQKCVRFSFGIGLTPEDIDNAAKEFKMVLRT